MLKGRTARVKKLVSILLAVGIFIFNHSGAMSSIRNMPECIFAEDEYSAEDRLSSFTKGALSISASSSMDEKLGQREVVIRLPGGIAVKHIPVFVGERPMLIPGGEAAGISIMTEGVLVVGLSEFTSLNGNRVSPCERAGVRAGDVILSVNGESITDSERLSSVVGSSTGSCIIEIERAGKRYEIMVEPIENADGRRSIGAWVRDSTVGIGTLSFYDDSGRLAALGHPVVDADTGSLLRVSDGRLTEADIIGVTKGVQGAPGELHGIFGPESRSIGTVDSNTELGVFGFLSDEGKYRLQNDPIPVSFPDEVHTGEAVIISCASGKPEAYTCVIISTGRQSEPAPKGLVICVTDEELIGFTGGIVQGMSGSPIIQDGKLAGVLTHVFINDPKKGYGAYAYWINRESEKTKRKT